MPGEDKEYTKWLRAKPCSMCGSSDSFNDPIQIHHSTRRRALGRRAHDHDSMPLCLRCHRHFHDAAGRFAGWTRGMRRAWQGEMVRKLRAEYEACFGPEIF